MNDPTAGPVAREALHALLGDAGPAVAGPSADVFDRALRGARAELARTADAPALQPGLPRFFRRELLRLGAAVAVPTALLLALHLLVLRTLPGLLADVLPAGVVWTGAAIYAVSSLGWLALALSTLPFAAHRRALQRGRRHS